jgi:hypothetical protein
LHDAKTVTITNAAKRISLDFIVECLMCCKDKRKLLQTHPKIKPPQPEGRGGKKK